MRLPESALGGILRGRRVAMSRLGSRFLLVGSVLLVSPLVADEEPACRSHLVPCNIGQHYSGTVRWVSTLATSAETVTDDVTARVTRGRVACEGSITRNGPSGRAESIRGGGLLVVEWGRGTEDDPDAPWYRIAVACPGAGGPAPADMTDAVETYKQPRRKGFAVLEGAVQEEHPDADPVNGVTGTWSLKWSLAIDR
jgi:hypothetical protein